MFFFLIFYLFEHVTCLIEFLPTYHTTNAMELVSYPISTVQVKGKAIPLQALTGLGGSRRLRIPDFKTVGT
jgi:hypothetical protein